ncbi:hypothetical protein [Streptococcus intermedius]|uniref:hypothetical protein n=1 Tax=Streptococcus intermedius TaxID=1338 RepID=UPI000232A5B6|nr:hypothetical protein [Streptococcus intermedius]EHG11256.1 hypothetical protein HMPREF9177_01835 [Streptococcus intermedius F0413]QKH77275.1 hypothetical protein FOC71_01565 [Streptococcus intermedius]
MIDKRLKAEIIPAAVLLNNFISNGKDSNYEFYLLEYLNQSQFFQEKSKHLEYKKPRSESNSEPDAFTPLYKIDFKLLASTTYLRALRLASPSISIPHKGIIAYGTPREPNKYFEVGEIHKIFRPLTLDNMLRLRENQHRRPLSKEDDILNVLNTIETEKNLLLFFPYRFFIEEEIELEELTFIIKEVLENYFTELAKYRSYTVSKFETYIVTECNDSFFLFTFNPISFQFVERVNVNILPTYIKLLNISRPFI